ncbi:hypothetical protein BGZ57DRAFT_195109 [Hyaloscypha finlandica]|nr:hypothetical protein BGZ57DRAFT_195109 [Hyaloscypha finlandica]
MGGRRSPTAGLDSRDLLMSYYFSVVGFLSLVANLRSTSSNLLGAGSAGSGPFGLLTIARYQMLIWPRSGLEKWGLLALQGSPPSVAVSVAARTRVAKSNQGLAFIIENLKRPKRADCEGQEDELRFPLPIPATVSKFPGLVSSVSSANFTEQYCPP